MGINREDFQKAAENALKQFSQANYGVLDSKVYAIVGVAVSCILSDMELSLFGGDKEREVQA